MKSFVLRFSPLSLVFATILLTGCASSNPRPLDNSSVNLVFVVSPDLTYQVPGDVDPTTANLTSRGLQRTLALGSFLKKNVLGGSNVTSIYALQPMTHLQTAGGYPDMAALQTVQQFALLNQITLPAGSNSAVTGNSFPLYASYSPALVPLDVAQPVFPCTVCQGLDFNDAHGENEILVDGIVQAKTPGYYIFSAPWETVSTLMANISRLEKFPFAAPAHYLGPNYVYAISIAASGGASLLVYNSNLNPPSTYPELPVKTNNACAATPFNISVAGGSAGAVVPAEINRNETVYFVRHAEAHPIQSFEDGNLVGAGQWRALALPVALKNKIHPDAVYAVDPSVAFPSFQGSAAASYIRPSMTVLPYAIANNLPFKVAASFPFLAQNPPQLATDASDFFFTGGRFSNRTILLGWEHNHIPVTVNALLASYQSTQTVPDWGANDYDSIWTIKIDGQGNLSVDNSLCEGINSADLPKAPPEF